MSQQSQADDVMEEMIVWDREKCLQNLDTGLPKAISRLEECAFIEQGIGILKIICNSFLPCVPTEQLEDRLFRNFCKPTCSLVDSTLSKIHVNVKGCLKESVEKSVISECLEWLIGIAQCVETCVKHISTMSSSVELADVLSLLYCAVHVLKQAYTQCKESNEIYGDLLEQIAKPLSDLFKTAHSLQMSLLNLLDKISVSGAPLEEYVLVLCSVCNGLFEICGIVTSLDVKLVISLWKALSRICHQHLNLMRDRFDICPLINFLCDEVGQGFQYLFQLCPGADPDSLSQGDDKAFSKLVKILGFQMKVVVALLRDFADYLGSCEDRVLNLLLSFHRLLPPDMSASKISGKQEGEIRAQIVNATIPIIGHLVGNRVFRSGVTSKGEDSEQSSADRLPRLLLQLLILDILPKHDAEVIDLWLTPSSHNKDNPTIGLLPAIFYSVEQCELEMRVPVMLPGVMIPGKPQRNVSLYEHTATHVCGFIGACLARHFSMLENTLLENVLWKGNLCSLLATDCWCFLVRYGTAKVCKDQVQCLVQAYLGMEKKKLSVSGQNTLYRLRCLIQRLVKFMSPEHQEDLLKQFPLDNNPDLWMALVSKSVTGDRAKNVTQQLINWALSVLEATTGKTGDVFKAIWLLTELLSGQLSVISNFLSPQQQSSLLDVMCRMWEEIHATPQDQGPIRESLITWLLPLTRCMLQMMETEDILKVLMVVQNFINNKPTPSLALAASSFMGGFGTLKIAPSFQQTQVLDRFPQVFHTLLIHPDPLVHHQALSSFANFASQTIHEHTIPACIQENDLLQTRVENFLNKVPHRSQKTEFVLVNYLKEQIDRSKRLDNSSSNDAKETEEATMIQDKVSQNSPQKENDNLVDEDFIDRPSKRARLTIQTSENPTADSTADSPQRDMVSSSTSLYHDFLVRLNSLATDLESECSKSAPPPSWFVDASKQVIARINDCVSPTNNWFDSLK